MADVIAIMKVHNQDQFRRLSRRLKEAGQGGLQRDMTREIRREGAPALAAVRAAWGGIEVTSSAGGGESSGLRARVAAATSIELTGTGIRIRVRSAAVDPRYGRQLVFGLDALHNWTHPVFGDRDTWERQRGQEVFFSTLYPFEPHWRAGIERAMEDTARKIAS